MLTRLHIDNYKTLVNFDLDLRKLNLWVGKNGTGKTSVVEVLRGIRDLFAGKSVPDVYPTTTLTRWQQRNRQQFSLNFSLHGFGQIDYDLHIEHDRERKLPLIAFERARLAGRNLFLYENGEVNLFRDDGSPGPHFPFGKSRSFIPEIEPVSSNHNIIALREFVASLRVLRPDPLRISPIADGSAETLGDGAENLANWYQALSLSRPDQLPRFFRSLEGVIPGFANLRLPNALAGRELLASVRIAGKECSLRFDELSEGQRMLMALYAASLDIEDGVWIYDEPDNYVALPEIQPWLVSLRESIEMPNAQAIVISHHPESIDYLAADGASIFFVENGITKSRALSGIDLNGASLSEALANNLVG